MKVLVWNENQHEKTDARVTELYPGGLHQFIAGILKSDTVEVRTATLDDEHCGITEEILDDTDVLIWWGHMAHDRVPDDVVDMVQRHVLGGMGLFLLHSAHFSKIFKRRLSQDMCRKSYIKQNIRDANTHAGNSTIPVRAPCAEKDAAMAERVAFIKTNRGC